MLRNLSARLHALAPSAAAVHERDVEAWREAWADLRGAVEAAEPDACPVVDVELRHETLVRSAAEGGPPTELGLAVRWIRIAAAG